MVIGFNNNDPPPPWRIWLSCCYRWLENWASGITYIWSCTGNAGMGSMMGDEPQNYNYMWKTLLSYHYCEYWKHANSKRTFWGIGQLRWLIRFSGGQRRPNAFDVGPTLSKCYKNVLYLLGGLDSQEFYCGCAVIKLFQNLQRIALYVLLPCIRNHWHFSEGVGYRPEFVIKI